MITVKCVQCGKETRKRLRDLTNSKSGDVFCSNVCFGEYRRIVHLCVICGSQITPNGRRVLSRKYCSRACSNKGRRGTRYDGTQPRSKQRKSQLLRNLLIEDRGEACERCQYSEEPRILVIHHIFERARGGSDDLDNLELLCPNCHAKHHLVAVKENPALVSRASLNLVA